ncbi:glutamate racemase [Alkalibacter mobilis]|uniref:glutamate racemase n=1 Tax=Alkalibacter mobilis TaxID=2787712 RepID=UPI00189F8304|nr:glutamate racemase [Alkalibacter mobilis]MBF7095955.1 glutamate racemase [Alkalibacter mobilis]
MSDKNLPIGVMDSGVGGLTVVKEIIKSLPSENIIYFGDSKRMPYGNRTEEEIVFLANEIIKFLENNKVKAILLACNTVSSQIDKLKHEVPIFGIIEAGCMAALESSESSDIGLIATVATVKSGVYDKTLKMLDRERHFVANDSRKLPQIINDQLKHKYLLDKHIHECIDPILEKGDIKELILGCSHFPIIENEIAEIYPGLKLINPASKQVKLLEEYLESNNIKNDGKGGIKEIYTTGGTKEFAETLERLHITNYKLSKVQLLKEDTVD